MATEPLLPPEILALDPVRRAVLLAMSRAVTGAYELARDGRVRFGRGVVANHRLVIRGPGRVEVGDGANLYAFSGRTVLDTRTPHARILIGARTRLNETLVQAATLVEIGDDCILARAHILDTDMHSIEPDRRTNPWAPVRSEPIVIEDNVWVARAAAILPGVRVGAGSVVGYGAVVTADVPPGVLVAGNPARVVREL
jgi:acyl-[acyl carrier protein]--UDP-N-acetylglucosamine O-acyltransferase